MITIAVLEDNVVLRNRMVGILFAWDYIESIASFSRNADFFCHAATKKVDILLADLHIEDGSGIDSIAYLSLVQPDSLSIVISALSDSDTILHAITMGAVGYLHKDDSSFEIIASIKLALSGESPISPTIARNLIRSIHTQDQRNKIKLPILEQGRKKSVLTGRETEVLNLIAKGMSYTECAAILNISKQTVPVHVRNIYRKLHVKNRSEAVFEARFLGVIE